MRSTQKEISKTQTSTITVVATSEAIVNIIEEKKNRIVYVVTEYLEHNGNVIGEESTIITESDYDLLMQESPEYAPQKPFNEYRESDLWHIIDLIRAR